MITRMLLSAAMSLVPIFGFAQTAERNVTVEAQATVQSVDPETRRIVLENAETGETEVIVAGPEIANFDQIEAGDTVKAVYTLGIAARIADADEMDSVLEVGGRAAQGEKPGGLAGTMVTLVFEFLSFDPEKSIAVVKDSGGDEQMIAVETDAGREFAAELTAGDKVALTFTEGLAVGIVEE